MATALKGPSTKTMTSHLSGSLSVCGIDSRQLFMHRPFPLQVETVLRGSVMRATTIGVLEDSFVVNVAAV